MGTVLNDSLPPAFWVFNAKFIDEIRIRVYNISVYFYLLLILQTVPVKRSIIIG